MDNQRDLRDELLEVDGIDAHQVSDAELQCFDQLLDRVLPGPARWRCIMQLRITKLAIAAVILIAAGVYFLGGSVGGTSVALADVLEQIHEFRPYRCRVVVEEDGQEVRTYTLERLSLSQRREISPDGSIMVIDLSVPKELFLQPQSRQAHEHWLDMEPRTDFDLLAHARAMQEGAVEDLGTDVIEGHDVQGFHTGNKHNDLTLWADIDTMLPVRFRIIHVQRGRKITLDQFEFDVPFDEALFSTTAPEGYTVKKTGKGYTDVARVGEGLPEEPLLTGLKVVAEFFDGVFPPAIELPQLQQAIRQYIKDNELSEEEVEQRLLPVSDYWTKAVWYINGLKHTQHVKDLQYVGAGVQRGDAATAILWWQPADGSTYQVVYGDLRVETLSADAVVELKDAVNP